MAVANVPKIHPIWLTIDSREQIWGKFEILRMSTGSNFFSISAYTILVISTIQFTIEPLYNPTYLLPFYIVGILHIISSAFLIIATMMHSKFIEDKIENQYRYNFVIMRELFGFFNILICIILQGVSYYGRTHSEECEKSVLDFEKNYCNGSGPKGTISLDSIFIFYIFIFINYRVFDNLRWEFKLFAFTSFYLVVIIVSLTSSTMHSPNMSYISLVFFAPIFLFVYIYSHEFKKVEQLVLWLQLFESDDYTHTKILQSTLEINVDWYLSIYSTKQTRIHLKNASIESEGVDLHQVQPNAEQFFPNHLEENRDHPNEFNFTPHTMNSFTTTRNHHPLSYLYFPSSKIEPSPFPTLTSSPSTLPISPPQRIQELETN